jgi:hypothetical protein
MLTWFTGGVELLPSLLLDVEIDTFVEDLPSFEEEGSTLSDSPGRGATDELEVLSIAGVFNVVASEL